MSCSKSRKWVVLNGMVLIAPWDYDLIQNLKTKEKFRIDPDISIPEGFKKVDFKPLPKRYWALERRR